jgi:hypothetical protein
MKWLCYLIFAPNETVKINVEWVDGSNYPPAFEKRTNLRLGIDSGRWNVSGS